MRMTQATSKTATVFPRPGFTLVELLVAISIFVILSTLALGAFNTVSDGDRGPAASRSFRAWVEGAKSRAAKLGRPVGIQPYIDSSEFNGHAVSRWQYVANVEPITGNLDGFAPVVATTFNTSGTPRFSVGGNAYPGLFYDNTTGGWIVRQNFIDPLAPAWSAIDGLNADGSPNLSEPAVLAPGLRIEIPANSGNWYRISALDPRTSGMANNPGTFNPSHVAGGTLNGFFLADDVSGSRSTFRIPQAASPGPPNRPPAGMSMATAYNSTRLTGLAPGELTYRIELGPDLLEGERLLSLPGGMFVDLDASQTPPSGFPADGPDTDTSAFNDPYTPVPLMFSPTGKVIGEYEALGPITFYFANRDELTEARGRANHPVFSAMNYDNWTRNFAYVSAVPISDPQVLTVLPNTGFVQKSVVFPVDADTRDSDDTITTGTPDGFSDDPFRLRLQGELGE